MCSHQSRFFTIILVSSLMVCLDRILAQTTTTLDNINENGQEESWFTSTVNPLAVDMPKESYSKTSVNLSGFNITFLNDSYQQLIDIYNNNKNNGEDYEDPCEIDQLLATVLPSNFKVANDFDLQTATTTTSVEHSLRIIERLIQLGRNVSQSTVPLSSRLTNQLSFLLYEIQLSPPCLASVIKITTAMRNNELWALKFLDASGKFPSGILEGTLSGVGDYNQCLNIRIPSNDQDHDDGRNQPQVTGKYCLARPVIPHPHRDLNQYKRNSKTKIPFGIPDTFLDELADFLYFFNRSLINVGVCLPSTCSAAEVEHSLNSILYPITNVPIEIGPESTCQQAGKTVSLDQYQWMAIYIFGSLISMTVLASFYEYLVPIKNVATETKSDRSNDNSNNNGSIKDVYQTSSSPPQSSPSLMSRVIVSFSLVNNTKALFESKPNKFGSIDFLRFLMLMNTIIMHNYYVAIGWSSWPFTKHLFTGLLAKVGTETKYGFLRNLHNTDFFFALTGLLLTYSMLRQLERRHGRFNYVQFIINMYFRFYPAVFGTILMYYLLPLFGNGPFWHLIDQYYVQSCRQQLISSMLTYNFYTVDLEHFLQHSMCNIASWWVNSCFHLIVLAPLLLIPLHRFRHSTSLVLLVSVIIVGNGLSIGHLVYKNIPYMNQLAKMDRIFDESFYSIFYTWPFIHHISPFVLGMTVGFLIHHYPAIYLGGFYGELLLTFIFVGTSVLGFHWTQDILKSPNDLTSFLAEPISNWEVYLNITVGKLMFCSGFLWIFYLCCTNRNNFWNNLFKFESLKPIYSLSLGIYLTNFLPPILVTFRTRDLIEFDDFLILQNCAFNTVLTILLSYILYILFEKPVMNLLKIMESK